LANQHAESLYKLLGSVAYSEKLLLLTGSMSASQKQHAYESIADGSAQFIVGTHALFQDKVSFDKLGLVIVDEQHRFGVEQRKKLQSKAYKPSADKTGRSSGSPRIESESVLSDRGVSSDTSKEEKLAMNNSGDPENAHVLPVVGSMPHVVSMTATPIPRSLALTLYGEMDVSVIAEMPPGRIPVETELFIPENREKVYAEVIRELEKGHQGFVVCPQIEEDDAGRLSVKKIHEQLSRKWLKNYNVGLLHGKMKAEEKEAVMQDFVSGKLHVLVATTVIEVGVDVPNASIMVIEGADKFGLAQIHQLRGRVGRGADKSYCYLVLSENKEPSKRLRLLERETNGFKLAEYDLEVRGPGAIYGTMQHGALDLRVAKLTDIELIESARAAAKQFIDKGDDLLKYPHLHKRVQLLRTITNLN
jgi:ATP-dependent DNA helicase RecG